MVNDQLHIIMPVKDSIAIAERAIHAIVDCGYTLCVYDDNSQIENAKHLDKLVEELHIKVVHLSDLTDHPSPNYRLVLQLAEQEALATSRHLLIVESDVIIKADTLNRMLEEVQEGVGMVAAVTVNEEGEIKLIEYNISGFGYWVFMFTGQKCFGEYTDEVIEYCVNRKKQKR